MRKGKRSSPRVVRGYLLSHQAHFTLLQARNQLQLLAELTSPRDEAELDRVFVQAAGLADCFDRLARDLDGVLAAAAPTPLGLQKPG
jgi:hypothetical protein